MQIGKKDFVWSYTANILNVSVNAILLPFTLAFFNSDELGLWYVFASISTLVSLLDFGFTPTVARNIAYSWSGATSLKSTSIEEVKTKSEVDAKLFCIVLQTCKAVYCAIGFFAFLILSTVGTVYIWNIAKESECAYWMQSWIVYAISIVLSLLFTYANAYLRGIGAVAEGSKASVAARVAHLISTVILLFAGFGLLATSIGYFFSVFFFRILSKIYFENNSQVKQLKANCNKRVSLQEIKAMFLTIWPNSWRDGLVSLSTFLSTQINTLICSLVLGLSSTGFYGLALQVSSVIMTIGAVWYSTVQPKLQEDAVKKQIQHFSSLFAQSAAVYTVVSIPLTAITVLVLPPIIHILRNDMNFDTAMYIVVCFYIFFYRGNSMCISGISNFNIVPYTRGYVLTGAVSVSLSYIFAVTTNLGIWSLIVAPCIAFFTYNAWKWPSFLLRMLNISARDFVKEGRKGLKEIVKRLCRRQ